MMQRLLVDRSAGTRHDPDTAGLDPASPSLGQSFVSLLAAASLDAIVCVGIDGRITYWNASAELLTGFSSHEAIGSFIHFLLPPHYGACNAQPAAALAHGRAAPPHGTAEVRIRRKDAGALSVDVTWSTWSDHTGASHAGAFLRAPPASEPVPQPLVPSARALLDAVIENVPAMLFVKDMLSEDSDGAPCGRYVLLNRAGEQMLGRSRSEIVGRSDRDLFPPELADQFCRNDEQALRSQTPCVHEDASVESKDGGQVHLRTRKLALPDVETGAARYVLGISEDVSERLRDLHALRDRSGQFDAAIRGMSHGLCMVDSAERMIVCNAHYLTMFDLDPEIIRPGIPFLDILRHSVATGTATQGVDELYAIRKAIIEAGQAVTYREALSDGRTIAISHRPMPVDREGPAAPGRHGGWVSIYEDVTRQLQAEQALQEQNRRFDAALGNMGQGLCMFDADGRLLVFNDAYLSLFGLTRDDVRIGELYGTIVERLVARGCYAKGVTSETVWEGMRSPAPAGEPSAMLRLREMSDGRTIAASVRPMPGGGWVSTFEDVTERRRSEAQIAHMARHDGLTNLPNRANFQELLDHAVGLVAGGGTAAVFYIDLDGFKAVNDTLGHAAGDAFLKAVAERLQGCIRATDTVARLGGDEFAIVQIGIAGPADAGALAERLLTAAGEPLDILGRSLRPRISIGIAIAPVAGIGTDELLRGADAAMYRAKAAGGHAYTFFAAGMEGLWGSAPQP